jgi:signal transduction histidine kinase
MDLLQPPPPRSPPGSPVAQSDDLLLAQNLLISVTRACDVLFGITSLVLAALGFWLFLLGDAHITTVIALWLMPLINVVWSVATRKRKRITSDLIRGLVCLPITAFIYVAEQGVFEKMWIPALLMTVGIGLLVGLSARSGLLGCAVTFVYAATLFGSAWIELGRCDLAALDDSFGLWLTGCVVSVVANKLGRTVDEARRQRDAAREQKDRAEAVMLQLTERSCELTTAIDNLHTEMNARMRIEVELRQAQKLESVGRLAAGVAHEINTPVQFVSDSLQFVRDGMTDLFVVVDRLETVQRQVLDGAQTRDVAAIAATATDSADLPYLVEHIPKAVDRALEGLDRVATIVRSMKEFAHPDSKTMADADLNHAIESTLTMARNEYKYVAELETELGELPPVRCHVGELNQAVLNIVVNAAHAIADVVRDTGGKGRIRVRTYRDADDVVIAIADTGGGIPEHTRDHIFDPFFTTKEVGRGTGQGLAIARSVIVDKHHGRLDFETRLGEGTTFFIRLAIDGAPDAFGAEAA